MTPEQYQTLSAELSSGHPLTGAYSSDDAEALVQLGAVNRPGPIPAKDVIKLVIAEGMWAMLKASSTSADVELVEALAVFDDFDLQDLTPINTSGQTAREVVVARLDASSISQLRDVIIGLEANRRSRRAELDLPGSINAGTIKAARA